MKEAHTLLSATIKTLEESPSSQDTVVKRLISDMKECEQSLEMFHSGGSNLLKTQVQSHAYQRSVAQTQGSYETKTQSKIVEKANKFN